MARFKESLFNIIQLRSVVHSPGCWCIRIILPRRHSVGTPHDDVIQWKHVPRYWPFVRGIHRPPVISPHEGRWRGALMFSLICAWINDWVNNRETGDLRRHGVPIKNVGLAWRIRPTSAILWQGPVWQTTLVQQLTPISAWATVVKGIHEKSLVLSGIQTSPQQDKQRFVPLIQNGFAWAIFPCYKCNQESLMTLNVSLSFYVKQILVLIHHSYLITLFSTFIIKQISMVMI